MEEIRAINQLKSYPQGGCCVGFGWVIINAVEVLGLPIRLCLQFNSDSPTGLNRLVTNTGAVHF